jgi:hypothetical protein
MCSWVPIDASTGPPQGGALAGRSCGQRNRFRRYARSALRAATEGGVGLLPAPTPQLARSHSGWPRPRCWLRWPGCRVIEPQHLLLVGQQSFGVFQRLTVVAEAAVGVGECLMQIEVVRGGGAVRAPEFGLEDGDPETPGRFSLEGVRVFAAGPSSRPGRSPPGESPGCGRFPASRPARLRTRS